MNCMSMPVFPTLRNAGPSQQPPDAAEEDLIPPQRPAAAVSQPTSPAASPAAASPAPQQPPQRQPGQQQPAYQPTAAQQQFLQSGQKLSARGTAVLANDPVQAVGLLILPDALHILLNEQATASPVQELTVVVSELKATGPTCTQGTTYL